MLDLKLQDIMLRNQEKNKDAYIHTYIHTYILSHTHAYTHAPPIHARVLDPGKQTFITHKKIYLYI